MDITCLNQEHWASALGPDQGKINRKTGTGPRLPLSPKKCNNKKSKCFHVAMSQRNFHSSTSHTRTVGFMNTFLDGRPAAHLTCVKREASDPNRFWFEQITLSMVELFRNIARFCTSFLCIFWLLRLQLCSLKNTKRYLKHLLIPFIGKFSQHLAFFPGF